MTGVRKVLHVIPSVGPLRGGPSEMVRALASRLTRNGVETHVATTNDNGQGTLPATCGVPTVEDNGVTYWYFPRQIRFYTFSWPMSSWLRQRTADFDIIHIHALFSFAALPAAYWAYRRGVPYVVRPLGTLSPWGMRHRRPWLKRLSFRLIESHILRHAALIHYTSEQERQEAEALGVKTPAVVMPNALPGSSPERFVGAFRRQHPEVHERPLILYLSRLDPKKGIDLLLRAFATVRKERPDACLVIAGDGEPAFVSALKQEARMLGVEDDVLWAGFLAGDDKDAALADALMFVLPSYSENFGIAVGEAMAAGLPVVVSDQVGIHPDISSSEAGLVVRCDSGELAQAMLRLLHDTRLCALLGLHGRQLAASKYSQDVVTADVLSLYNGIAS